MALPILDTPKYELTIPSSNKKVTYRPFLVKEEKILLIAQETNDPKQMMSAMKDIVSSCTFDKIKIDDITSFDLEYIFLKLRTKSVGENASVGIACSSCEALNQIDINLDSISVNMPTEKNDVIMLTDSIGVKMKWLTAEKMENISEISDKDQGAILNELVISSFESIFDSENVYLASESSKEELTQFVNSLNRQQMEKIEKFIANVPKLEHSCEFTCTSCKQDNNITLQGIQSFFE